jgi:DNA-binding phage protein
MSNVIPLHKRAQPGNLRDDDEPIEVQARAIINARVREYMAGGGRLNALALKAGLSVATVSRLAYYETTRPQFHTIMVICRVLRIPIKIG